MSSEDVSVTRGESPMYSQSAMREPFRFHKTTTPYKQRENSILINAMSDPISICESALNLEYISSRMLELPNHQGSRMYKKYVLGYTEKEIALYEGVSVQTVNNSLRIAKSKIHDVFVECGVVA